MHTIGWPALIVLSIGLACCGDMEASGAPSLLFIDSISLQETHTAFIVEPYDLIVDSQGRLLVSDGYSGHILVFSSDGSLLETIGRKGEGPGEFAAPTQLAMGGDSLLYVVDGMVVKKLEMPGARFLESIDLPGMPGSLSVSGDRLIVGQSDVENRTSFAYSDDSGDTFSSSGFLPDILTNPFVGPMFGWITLAASHERVATAYTVTNSVSITDLTTGVSDSVVVPVVERWGSKPDVFAQLGATPTQEIGEAAMASSTPVEMYWLPSGHLAVVYADAMLEGTRFVGEQYLSLVAADARRVCAEVRVPGVTNPKPTVGFSGDTLLVLSQPVDSVSARAMIHRYVIDARSCPGFE